MRHFTVYSWKSDEVNNDVAGFAKAIHYNMLNAAALNFIRFKFVSVVINFQADAH